MVTAVAVDAGLRPSYGLHPATPVIVGNLDDVHVTAVMEELTRRGGNATVLDADLLDAGGGRTAAASRSGGTAPPGWIRRLATPDWRPAVDPESPSGAARAAWLTWLTGWIDAADVRWLTTLRALVRADNKLVQIATARALDIPTPQTVVATCRADIVEFGDKVVVKPLGPDQYIVGGEARHVPAQQIAVNDLTDADMAVAPFLYQQVLRARRHLRVVTVGSRVFVAALDAAGLPLDWREHDAAHDAFEPASYPRVAASAIVLAQALEVGYSSQDWIETDEDTYFLDLNPAGQWLFLPSAVADQVTAAHADWLLAP